MIHARSDYNHIQDPHGKIGKDEPVFLIRAKDQVSASAVKAWAELNAIAGGDGRLTTMAYEHAKSMEVWQRKNSSKPADL